MLQTQFNDVSTKTKILGIAREASSKLALPESHVFATIAEAQKQIEFLQKTLSAKGPKCLKAASAAVSLLTLSLPDVDVTRVDRGRYIMGNFVENMRNLSNLGGVDTIRYQGLNHTELNSMRSSFQDGQVMSQFVTFLSSQHEAVMMKDWVSWPDIFMWKAVDKMIQKYPTDTVFTESATLMNLITTISPMSPEVEHPDTMKRVLDIAIEAMTKEMDAALAGGGAQPGEAYKRAMTAAFDSLGSSWPLDTSEKLMYHDATGKYPPRQTASRAVAIAGALTADKYGIKPDI